MDFSLKNKEISFKHLLELTLLIMNDFLEYFSVDSCNSENYALPYYVYLKPSQETPTCLNHV